MVLSLQWKIKRLSFSSLGDGRPKTSTEKVSLCKGVFSEDASSTAWGTDKDISSLAHHCDKAVVECEGFRKGGDKRKGRRRVKDEPQKKGMGFGDWRNK